MINADQIQHQQLTTNRDGIAISLRDVQLVQLEMLKEIIRICTKHDISYFLEAGTLLGAVRHGGFIPWDDDLDIGLTPENYQKLLTVMDSELDSSRFIYHCLDNNKRHNVSGPAMKIRRLNTYSPEPFDRFVNYTGQQGIFLDVFVYDHAGPNNCRYFLYRTRIKLLMYILALLMLLNLHLKFLKQHYINLAHNYAKKYHYSPLLSSSLTWVYTKRSVYQVDHFFPLTKIKFEDIEVAVPGHYHEVLTSRFGNYMQYPPEREMRFRHIQPKLLTIDTAVLQAVRQQEVL